MIALAAGFGCGHGCPWQQLRELLLRSLDENGLQVDQLQAIASVEHKRKEAGLHRLAEALGLALYFFDAPHLSRYTAQLTHVSPLAQAITGSAGVAESSALALAEQLGSAPAQLIVPRRAIARATVAIARVPVKLPR